MQLHYCDVFARGPGNPTLPQIILLGWRPVCAVFLQHTWYILVCFLCFGDDAVIRPKTLPRVCILKDATSTCGPCLPLNNSSPVPKLNSDSSPCRRRCSATGNSFPPCAKCFPVPLNSSIQSPSRKVVGIGRVHTCSSKLAMFRLTMSDPREMLPAK